MRRSHRITTQGLFDKAVKGVLSQGCASYCSTQSACLYRGPNGTKCAVGILITDESLIDDIEGIGIKRDGKVQRAVERSIGRKLTWAEIDMLMRLQNAHDDSVKDLQFNESFKICARRVAQIHDLKWRKSFDA